MVPPLLFVGSRFASDGTNGRARMFVPAIGFLLASPCLLLTGNTNVFILAVLGLVIYRLSSAFYDANLMPILCEIVDSRYRATSYGLLNVMIMVGGGFGIYLSGVLRDLKIDLSIVFDIVAATWVISAAILYFTKPNTTGDRTKCCGRAG